MTIYNTDGSLACICHDHRPECNCTGTFPPDGHPLYDPPYMRRKPQSIIGAIWGWAIIAIIVIAWLHRPESW